MDKETLLKVWGSRTYRIAANEEPLDEDVVYFRGLWVLMGMDVQWFKNGKVKSATLDGRKLSQKEARIWVETLERGDFYYNLRTQRFESMAMSDVIHERCKMAVMAAIQNLRSETEMAKPAPSAKSDLFKAVHAIVREIRGTCDSYRTAFALALREVYAAKNQALKAA